VEVLGSRIMLNASDFSVSREFYETTIGLKIAREYGVGGRVIGVVYFLGGGFLQLAQGDGPFTPGLMMWWQVADVRAEEKRLRALDVTIVKPAERMPWGLDELWIHDPDGVEIRIIEVPPEHPLRGRML